MGRRVGDLSHLRTELEGLLGRAGLDAAAVTVFADAVLVAGAAASGDALADRPLGFVPVSVADAARHGVARPVGAPGAVDAAVAVADRAQLAIESLNQVVARLEAARLLAAAEAVTAMGVAELARRGVSDPGELSATARERWRARVKSRVRQDLGPATGWSQGETATFVAVATAPAPFRVPAAGALSRGTVSWQLVRGLWRACGRARLSAADAAHVAEAMLADVPGRCVPERLEADGTAKASPWGHAEFWAALDREVTKLAASPDPADEASVAQARAARAARDAAYAARSMFVRVADDGTAQVTFTGSVLTVVALGDRLDRAARAARGAGDARTVVQLANDIGLALLGHATIGAHELPDLDIFAGREVTPEDLAAAGWTPQVISALSALPPAVLQVVVPLLALHDPTTAPALPTSDLPDATSDHVANRAGPGGADPPWPTQGVMHTGAAGCPACAPSARSSRHRAVDEASRRSRGQGPEPGHAPQAPAVTPTDPARVAWVGRVLGRHAVFVPPDVVRGLAASPGSTVERLLVDPADGRCLERTVGSYPFDASMRAQLAAADLTCRAPGCTHDGAACQVDHVAEFGTAGGQTREANGQLAHVWHHEPKTAKAWDAVLHQNRDVTWTTTLSRVYRTRVHDYRELVTVLTDALDRVAAVPEQDRADQANAEVYQALCYRGVGERLNEGDDDPAEELHLSRFGGWGLVSLRHTDPATGQRIPGASPAVQARADAAAALCRTPGETARSTSTRSRTGRTARPGQGAIQPASSVRRGGSRSDGAQPDDTGARRRSGQQGRTQRRGSPRSRLTWEQRQRRAGERLIADEGIPPF